MGNKKKMTVLDFQKYKDEGRKFSFVTAYDYTTASIVNESDCEIILVGDSLGMIMLGYNTTVPVTVDTAPHTWSNFMRMSTSSAAKPSSSMPQCSTRFSSRRWEPISRKRIVSPLSFADF